MDRWYFDCSLAKLPELSPESVLGSLAAHHDFALDSLQRESWLYEVRHLQSVLAGIDQGHLFLEFTIPRMGRRADVVIVAGATIFVVEYKVGAKDFTAADRRQTVGYAIDLRNFHEGSHDCRIVPVLLATGTQDCSSESVVLQHGVNELICTSGSKLQEAIRLALSIEEPSIDPINWAKSRYKPTPTIVEAAMSLYAGHSVAEISRSDAGAVNLTTTAKTVADIIEHAKQNNEKAIVFVSGVPGSGKTLAGLNIATARARKHEDEHAVFLSGNGPLVTVLRESLARDRVRRADSENAKITKKDAARHTSSFVQNVHHFRDEALASDEPPIERVVVFDEAQRAWDLDQTAKFMKKRGRSNSWDMSEPEFLVSAMDRHIGWCVIVCLIGNGQEIHTGEAGISEWFNAITNRFSNWHVFVPHSRDKQAKELQTLSKHVNTQSRAGLHLSACIRSFRSEHVSAWVDAVLSANTKAARSLLDGLSDYPIRISRDLQDCREWLRRKSQGTDRFGLVASSNAIRLKPHGIHVKAKISVENWFLDWEDDVRSSQALEDVATEFDVQGLELDWTLVCWDANLRFINGCWEKHRFKGSKWQNVNSEADCRYLVNTYRVLLTRARQGMVIFVPPGDALDATRPPTFYDQTYELFKACGAVPLCEETAE